jgi:flavin-binding protein dodecin
MNRLAWRVGARRARSAIDPRGISRRPRLEQSECRHQARSLRETLMAMLKVIEVLAESGKSWEDAAQTAVDNAAKTVRGIKSIYIKNLQAEVSKNGKISNYRVNAKISFEVEL